MTFCAVNDCSRQVIFKAEVDSGFCVEHLDIHLGDLKTRAELATGYVERWRNCFICIECGRTTADEDACCVMCGRDCMAFEDGKLVHKIVDHYDAIERQAVNLRAARDEACDGWERCCDSAMHFGARIAELRKVGAP